MFKKKLEETQATEDKKQENKVNKDKDIKYEDNGTYLPPVDEIKDDNDDDDDGDEWMKHNLKLVKHFEDFYRTGDTSYNPEADDYITIDPLQKQMEMEEELAKHKRERDGDWDKKSTKKTKK